MIGTIRKLSANSDEVEQMVRETGANYLIVESDIRAESSIKSVFDLVEREWGSVDILVNNAAEYDDNDTILTVSRDGYDKTYDVNVKGTLFMMQEFVRRYRVRNVLLRSSQGRLLTAQVRLPSRR